MLDVKILGPLVLASGGRPVPLGPQQRVLLIALLLAGGQYVSSPRLAELLWGGGAGERPAATLRSHIAHLRQSLGGATVPVPLLHTERLGGGAAYALRE